MLINCKSCKKKFLLNQREIDLEGSLITCEHCKNEWIYESRTHFLESKLKLIKNHSGLFCLRAICFQKHKKKKTIHDFLVEF